MDIVASLKDRMNVVHFFRNFDKYNTLVELRKVIQDARDQLLKRSEMEVDCFFHEMAIKTKKQCRVIRNDLKAVANQLATAIVPWSNDGVVGRVLGEDLPDELENQVKGLLLARKPSLDATLRFFSLHFANHRNTYY